MPESNSSKPLTYWDYIATDELLSLQRPLTTAHDEMQFIIVHQTFELWFKLAIYELNGALAALDANDIKQAASLLKRVASILRASLRGFDPLVTMSKEGYGEFRDALHPASGFQSSQFRVIEILVGIERVSSASDASQERFYWETAAAQTGNTFTNFMDKYSQDLNRSYDEAKNRNLRRAMLRVTEDATGHTGAQAYRHIFQHRNEFPWLAALADSANDLQQAILDFRKYHRKVMKYTVGDHAPGTSDAHAPNHPSCTAYLQSVIDQHSTIFPELVSASLPE